MTESRYEEARSDVGKVFACPQEIADAGDLSREQKIDLLLQWEIDLRQLMVAAEENMASPRPGEAAELLRSVQGLLANFGANGHEPAAVNKAGG